jgi:hypothetical protein
VLLLLLPPPGCRFEPGNVAHDVTNMLSPSAGAPPIDQYIDWIDMGLI